VGILLFLFRYWSILLATTMMLTSCCSGHVSLGPLTKKVCIWM